MSKVKWLACFIVHGLMAFKIWVDYWKMSYPILVVFGILFIFVLDIITFIRQHSEKYVKEIGEYDYNYDNFPIHLILFPLAMCCFQNIFPSYDLSYLTKAELLIHRLATWWYILATLALTIAGIIECIRVLGKSTRKRLSVGIERFGWGKVILWVFVVLEFYDFMTM